MASPYIEEAAKRARGIPAEVKERPTMKYQAHFSARKRGAIGQFYSVRVTFDGPKGLERPVGKNSSNNDLGFKLAWAALEASGHECHHLIDITTQP